MHKVVQSFMSGFSFLMLNTFQETAFQKLVSFEMNGGTSPLHSGSVEI